MHTIFDILCSTSPYLNFQFNIISIMGKQSPVISMYHPEITSHYYTVINYLGFGSNMSTTLVNVEIGIRFIFPEDVREIFLTL